MVCVVRASYAVPTWNLRPDALDAVNDGSPPVHEPRSWTQYSPCQWRLVVQPQACVAEKWSLTNRIRSHSARIKAAKHHRYQLWLLRKIGSPWRRSGHVRAVGRG